MTFLNPLGLLGLLGIIGLIIIYILKPKYTDKSLSSTHIWKLSLKYRRPKTPFDWLRSSLLFILQVIIITTLAILMIKPNYILSTLSGEKVIILDASASMKKGSDKTSFEMAKKEALALAERTVPKDRFTLILATNEPYYVIRRSDSLDYIKQSIVNLEATYEAVDLTKSAELLESILRENPNATPYMITSKEIALPENIQLIDVSTKHKNTAIMDFKAVLQPNGYYQFEAELLNYGNKSDVAITLYVNSVYQTSKMISIENDETKLISFNDHEVLTYQEAYITIDTKDGFMVDNDFRIYGSYGEPTKVLMYSESEDLNQSSLYYIRNALEALSKRFAITVITKEEDLVDSGYDLYIYDTYRPPVLPIDGAIWFLNIKADYDLLGIKVSNEITGDFNIKEVSHTTPLSRNILKGVETHQTKLTKYSSLSAYPEFESILEVSGDPVLLIKNNNGQKLSIFSFDLSFSNLPVLIDFPLLIQNLYKDSLPSEVDKQFYHTGDVVLIEPKHNAQKLTISINGDVTTYEDLSTIQLKLDKPGTYVVKETIDGKEVIKAAFFVKVPPKESVETVSSNAYIITYIPQTSDRTSKDLMDLTTYIALGLLLLLLIEWGLQYREQY